MPNPRAALELTANSQGVQDALQRVNQGLGGMAGAADEAAGEVTNSLNRAENAAENLGDQARNTDQDLERIADGLEEVARAADEAADEAERAAKKLEITGDAAGDLGDKGAKLAGVLGMIDPALGELAQGLGDFTDAAEVALGSFGGFSIAAIGIAPVIAGITIALAAGAAAYATYENATFEANFEIAQQQKALVALNKNLDLTEEEVQALSDSWQGFIDIGESVRQKIALINGELNEQQLELEEAQNAAKAAAEAQIAQDAKRIGALNILIDKNRQVIRSEQASDEAKQQAIESNRQAVAALEAANATLAEHKAALDETLDLIGLEAEYRAETEKAAERQTAATEAASRAEQKEAERLAALALEQQQQLELLEMLAKRTVDYQTAIGGMASVLAGLEDSLLSPLEQLEAEQEAAQARLLESYQAAAIAGRGSSEDQLAAWQDYRTKQERIDAIYADRRAEQIASDAEAQAKAQADALAAQETALAAAQAIEQQKQSFILGMATDTADLLALITEKGNEHAIESNKKVAKVLFGINKTASIASAAITGAQATLAAYKSGLELGGPLGLIVAPISAGIAAAFAGIQIATIASQQPSFHTGGFVDGAGRSLAPDEVPATLTRREAVLNPVGRETIGDDAIRAANNGQAPAQQPLVVVYQFKHKIMDAGLQENLNNGGVLSQVKNNRVRVGHSV